MDEKQITNYLPLSRRIFEHKFWKEKRVYSKFESWVDLLREARYKPTETTMIIGNKNVVFGRGELPVSLRYLAEKWGWSKHKVDSYLKFLVNDGMIKMRTAEGTAQTIISICNYDSYNPLAETTGTPEGTARGQHGDSTGTARGQNSNKEVIRDNKDKKEEKIINISDKGEKISPPTIEVRKENFKISLQPYVEKYGSKMLNDFFRHWTEKNENGRKMRFEKETVFEISKRLCTWKSNEEKFNSKNNGNAHKYGNPLRPNGSEPVQNITSYGVL